MRLAGLADVVRLGAFTLGLQDEVELQELPHEGLVVFGHHNVLFVSQQIGKQGTRHRYHLIVRVLV
jgi:hypothetical protein